MTDSPASPAEPNECPICSALMGNAAKHAEWHATELPQAAVKATSEELSRALRGTGL